MGSIAACEEIGVLLEEEGNEEAAMDFYRAGVERGNYNCYTNMASYYGRHFQTENQKKCWSLYFEKRFEIAQRFSSLSDEAGRKYAQKYLELNDLLMFRINAHVYLMFAVTLDWKVPNEILTQIYYEREEIMEAIKLETLRNPEQMQTSRKIFDWLANNIVQVPLHMRSNDADSANDPE